MSERTGTERHLKLSATIPNPRVRYGENFADAVEAACLAPSPDAGPLETLAWWHAPSDGLIDPDRADAYLRVLSASAVEALASATSLALFTNDRTDITGALVFACALHLAGQEDGARFWWQYAAGAGDPTAVYCLYLEHSRTGDYADAEVWADQLEDLPAMPRLWWAQACVRPRSQGVYQHLVRHARRGPYPDSDDILLPTAQIAKDALGLHPEPPAPGKETHPTPPAQPARPAPPNPPGSRPRRPRASAQPAPTTPVTSQAMREAQRALSVVRVLQNHRLGADTQLISRDTGLTESTLQSTLDMLVEEEFADRITDTVYAPGLALDRLALPGGTGAAAQFQRTLAIARQEVGAAVYLSRYADGDVQITQMSADAATPPVNEYIPFRQAAHASAVGKCLLTQLDAAGQADHISRYAPEAYTDRTITKTKALLDQLARITRMRPGGPAFDMREYALEWVCSAVPVGVGGEAASLALSLPTEHIHRLGDATTQLRRKAVPVMLALMLAGTIPADDGELDLDKAPAPLSHDDDGVLAPGTVQRLRRLFSKPLVSGQAIRGVAQAIWPGPHLVADRASPTVYFFDAAPPPGHAPSPFAVPQILTVPDPSEGLGFTPWDTPPRHSLGDLVVYRT